MSSKSVLVDRRGLWQTWHNILQAHADQPLLGSLVPQPRGSSDTSCAFPYEFHWTTYERLLTRVEAFGRGLHAIIQPQLPPGSRVGICGANCVEWIIAELACIRCRYLSVPIGLSFAQNKQSLLELLAELPLAAVVCEESHRSIFLEIDVPVVITFPSQPSADLCCSVQPVHIENERVFNMQAIEAQGQLAPATAPVEGPTSDVLTVYFTSGSTGVPKPIYLTEEMIVEDFMLAAEEDEDEADTTPPIQLAIFNFAYSLERDNFQSIALLGGSMGLFHLPLVHLFDTLALLQPTAIVGVPAIWNILWRQFEQDLSERTRACDDADCAAIRRDLASRYGQRFGDRLLFVSSGTAPLSSFVDTFLREVFNDKYVGSGYGLQETGLIAVNNVIQPGVQLKLRSLPELGYSTTDKPFPRGEILVKTPTMVPIDPSSLHKGWFTTGDIGELRTPRVTYAGRRKPRRKKATFSTKKRPREPRVETRQLFVIDRVKTIFKVSNGEYISPTKLESICSESKYVFQMFVYGDSTCSNPVAIVVPCAATVLPLLTAKLNEEGHSSDLTFSELCHRYRDYLASLLLQECRAAGSKHHFRPQEHIGALAFDLPSCLESHVQPQWSCSAGSLTTSGKLNRPFLHAHYRATLHDLCQQCCDPLHSLLAGCSTDGSNQVAAVDNVDLVQAGISSLTAVELSLRTGVPAQVLLEPGMTVSRLRALISSQTDSRHSENRYEADRVTSVTQQQIATDLNTDLCLDDEDDTARPMRSFAAVAAMTTPMVFLTGATGFLGSHLLIDLLSTTRARCVCLIRSSSEDAARNRLITQLQETKLWRGEWQDRVEICVGSLTEPDFGLDRAAFEKLAQSVDLVLHCGAQVDWLRPYSALRDANVAGTKTCTSLALRAASPFVLVSTGAVASLSEEQCTPERLAKESGYVASKAVAELWLARNAGRIQLPTFVFQPGAISAHSVTGFCSRADFISRYVLACLELSLAADSPALFEMIPLDFVASTIIRTIFHSTIGSGHQVLPLANPNSPSFRQLAELLIEVGFEIDLVSPDIFSSVICSASSPLKPLCSVLQDGFFDEDDLCDFGIPSSMPRTDRDYLQTYLRQLCPHLLNDSTTAASSSQH